MAVKIRLARGGSRNRPHFSIVVADGHSPRDGRFIEKIGTYDPLQKDDAKRFTLDVEKAKAWIAKGAQPSERVQYFLFKLGAGPKPQVNVTPKKSAPRAKTQERLKAAADAAEKASADAAKAAAAPKAEAAPAPAEAPAAEAPAAEAPAPEAAAG